MRTELAIWNAFTSGDRDAYTVLYKIYHPRLYNYGRKFVDNTELVEDCIQEVLVRIWLDRARLAEVQNIRSYLFVAFRNSLFKSITLHNKRSSVPRPEDDTFSMELSVDQVMINKERIYERHINLKQAMDKLSARQKEVIFFKFYENMSYEEVAQILNISKKATYKLVARALTELKTIYKQQDALFSIPSGLITFALSFAACM